DSDLGSLVRSLRPKLRRPRPRNAPQQILIRAPEPDAGAAPPGGGPEVYYEVAPTPPPPDATERLNSEIDRVLSHASGLILTGNLAAARKALDRSWTELIGSGSHVAGPAFEVGFGYLFKNLADAFNEAGDRRQADRYMGLAASAFTRVERQ